MTKQLIIPFLFLILSLSNRVLSQQWESVGGGVEGEIRNMYVDTVEDKIYIVGNFTKAGGQIARRVAVWDGSVWTSLNNNFLTGSLLDIVKYKNELIVSGSPYWMDSSMIVGGLAKLTPTGWQPFNAKPDDYTGLMEIIDNELYVGSTDSINGLPIKNIAKWNGTVWDSIGNQQAFYEGPGTYVDIGTVAKLQNNLIAAGNYNVGNFKEIAQFDGVDWLPLADGIKGEAWINKIKVYKDVLYVGGWFQQAAGNPSSYLMAWDGVKWFNPFADVEYTFQVHDLNVIDDALYIVGNYRFNGENQQYTFAKFDGTNFCAFGGSFIQGAGVWSDPKRIGGLNGEIYIICNRIFLSDTLNHFAKWIGTEMDSCIINTIASVQELNESNLSDFQVSPNPSSGTFNVSFKAIQAENVELRVQNYLGQELLVRKLNCMQGENAVQLDLHHLANGIYIVDVIVQNHRFTAKVVKQ